MLVPPSDKELSKVLSRLKEGRSAGDNEIMPELMKCGGADYFEHTVRWTCFKRCALSMEVPAER